MGSPRNRREKKKRAQKRADKRRRERSAARLGLSPEQLRSRPGLPKMSDTLVVFAEPLIEELSDSSDLESCRGALMLASLLWNGLTLLESDDDEAAALGEATLERVETTLAETGFSEEEVAELLDLLAERKEALFPDESRLVVSVDAERRGDRIHVLAASTYE